MKKIALYTFLIITFILTLATPVVVLAQNPPPGGEQFNGDQLIFGENYVLRTSQTLNGSLVVFGGNAQIENGATVNGEIVIFGGNLQVSGTVNGNISAIGSTVNLESTSYVQGDVQIIGGTVNAYAGSTVTGSINRLNPQTLMFNFDRFDFTPPGDTSSLRLLTSWMRDALANLLRILAMAVLAVVVALLLPRPLRVLGNTIADQTLLSGGIGLLTMVVAPFILIVLIITILLIPVALIAMLVLAIAMLIGWIAVGFQIGERIAAMLKTQWVEAVSAGIGTLILGLIVWLLGYLFCLGGLMSLLAASVGLGSIILTQFGTKTYPAPPTMVYVPTPTPPVTPSSSSEDDPSNPQEN
ncbi:MAG: polymer-forming cytoskeletal protein [Chloroflexota bacterium]